MQSLKIACGQFAPQPGDKTANLEKIFHLAQSAAGSGCQVIVFPELATTGYLAARLLRDLVEPLSGPTVQQLQSIASESGIGVVCGLAELDDRSGARHNSAVAIDCHGCLLGVYRKIHLWASEKEWAMPGVEFPLFDFGGFRAVSWICYDTRFPELGRLARQSNADVALVSTAWLGQEWEWDVALRGRAMDNQVAVAGADLVGVEKEFPCHGYSRIAAADGHLLAAIEPGSEGVLVAEIDFTEQIRLRQEIPLWQDRRPDIYRRLGSEL
ncbi:MAG TPA: nitrilase-related carbon-nitrogen hydrolase [bacterium]|nr:nitrilase-related carbon-nitrogen hydrolase [bacterium]HNT64158.1 nitrilase-related carbon-nitrogen hydrolase [bacterium]